MSFQPHSLVGSGALLIGILAGSISLDSDTRFRALAGNELTAVPNVKIVTVFDAVQDACFLLFVATPEAAPARRFTAQPSDVASAAAWRDRRLTELSAGYEQAAQTRYPGTLVNAFQFEWDAWKVQAEFERIVRESELAWLEEQLRLIAATPRVAVSGPVPCGDRPVPKPAR